MRMVIIVALALVAIAAGGVWAVGQFGGGLTGGVGEARAPLVREPEIVVAAAPAPAPSTNTKPALRSAPVTPKAAEPAKPVETPAPAAKPTTPAADPAAPAADPATPQAEPKTNLRTGLDDKSELKIPLPKMEKQQAQPSPEQPAAPAPQQPQTAEPKVQVQSADAPAQASAAATVPAGLEAQFKSRKVTYNRPPEKLALNKPVDVSLVINATEDKDAGKEALQGFPGTIVERDVDLSDTVSAQLTGVGFDITSQTVERQRLSGKTVNRWAWRVTPTETGTHTLILEIFGYASGSLDAEPLDAYRDEITVEVQQFDQIVSWAKGVQPVFAVLAALAAVGSAAFAFLRFREEKKQTKAMSNKPE
jgi:hypothetical protein